MAITRLTLRGEEINNYLNLITTSAGKHYAVTVENPGYPSYWITCGLLDVVQEFSKYRRRMEWVLTSPDTLQAFHAGNYVGHLQAGKVGRGQEVQAIFGAPGHSRPPCRCPQNINHNEEYSSSVKTAAKKASEMFVQLSPNQIISAFTWCVNEAFHPDAENSMAYATLNQHILTWRKDVLETGDMHDDYNTEIKLLRMMTYYLLDATSEDDHSDDWDAPERVHGAESLKFLVNKFPNKDRYMEEYRKVQRNRIRYEQMSNLGAVMCVNRIGKPTIILRSGMQGIAFKTPAVIYQQCETVEDLPVSIQEAYHATRLAGLHRYVEGTGMYMNEGTLRDTNSRILGSCVWLDPELFLGYSEPSLSWS